MAEINFYNQDCGDEGLLLSVKQEAQPIGSAVGG
jgi:hypothetical protein